jgi:hypothetical protein
MLLIASELLRPPSYAEPCDRELMGAKGCRIAPSSSIPPNVIMATILPESEECLDSVQHRLPPGVCLGAASFLAPIMRSNVAAILARIMRS